jgi:hypothetical protein
MHRDVAACQAVAATKAANPRFFEKNSLKLRPANPGEVGEPWIMNQRAREELIAKSQNPKKMKKRTKITLTGSA